MPRITDESELDAYYLSSPTGQRAAGVMWPAIVERRVDKLFSIGLLPDKAVHNELFQPSGALGNYAVKVRLAYLLGWIEKDVFDDLLILARIRNRFAHAVEAKDFTDQRIAAWLRNMKSYQTLPTSTEEATRAAREDPSFRNLLVLEILTDAIKTPLSAFRICIDILLSHLDASNEALEGARDARGPLSEKS